MNLPTCTPSNTKLAPVFQSKGLNPLINPASWSSWSVIASLIIFITSGPYSKRKTLPSVSGAFGLRTIRTLEMYFGLNLPST